MGSFSVLEVIGTATIPDGTLIALIMNKSDHRLDLVPLKSGVQWSFHKDSTWRIDGAHGEEIVRSFCIDDMVYPSPNDNNGKSYTH